MSIKMIDVDPNELDMVREGRKGRMCYPIVKTFLDSGKVLVKLDISETGKTFNSLYTSLNGYCNNHDVPVKVFSKNQEIYLMRLDRDKDGNEIANWKEIKDKKSDTVQVTQAEVKPTETLNPATAKKKAS